MHSKENQAKTKQLLLTWHKYTGDDCETDRDVYERDEYKQNHMHMSRTVWVDAWLGRNEIPEPNRRECDEWEVESWETNGGAGEVYGRK